MLYVTIIIYVLLYTMLAWRDSPQPWPDNVGKNADQTPAHVCQHRCRVISKTLRLLSAHWRSESFNTFYSFNTLYSFNT